MATIDLVILSSSPPKPHRHDATFAHAMSSSPSRLPPSNTLIRQNQTLRSGISAPSIVASLRTSASGLLETNNTAGPKQNDSIWDFPEDEMTGMEAAMPEVSKVKAAPKPKAKKAVAVKDGNGASESSFKKPRKARAKKTDQGDVGPAAEPALKQKAVRKPRAKKTDAEVQTKIPKGRITKSSAGSIPRNDGKAGDTVSAHFAKFANTEEYIDIDDITLDKGLNLQDAAKRRSDWTPPKATNKGRSFGGISGEIVDLDTPPKGLTDLLGSFGYSRIEGSSTSMQELGVVTARKRKLIELVKTNAMLTSPQVAPNTKAAKKRPATITERATAAYARVNEDDMEPTPLLHYLSHKDSASGASTNSRARSPVKKPKKGKKAAPPPPDLLGPQAAREQANRQEFVFGTSSQLAQDDDPAFLRDLQQAMQISNQSEDPFADLPPTRNAATSCRRKSPKKRPSLWEAALRIEEEGATEVEILDLISSSQVERELRFDRAASIATETIDTLEAAPQPDLAAPILLSDKPSVSRELPSQHANSVGKPDSSAELTKGEQCPNFESYSTVELAKEIASYKFKPIKKREQMISLLKKCWEGKQRAALGSLGVNTIINKAADKATPPHQTQRASQNAPASPQPKGRAGKDSGATSPMSKGMPKPTTSRPLSPHSNERLASDSETPTQFRQSPIKKSKRRKPLPEEISDSDASLTPSPPRRRASRAQEPPTLPLVEDDIADITLPPLSPNSAEKELFDHITKAVITAPRGIPHAPSWYEKMLMYDPIILEDLTRWLNTEGLDGVKYDGEAKAEQVKAWCRARSFLPVPEVHIIGAGLTSTMSKLNIGSKKPLKCKSGWPKSDATNAVAHALKIGYRHIDSAFMYRNEGSCGEAIKSSGIPRDEIFFTTKIYGGKEMSQEYAAKQIDQTIANSGLTYVDLILIHSPDGGPAGRKGAWKALVEAQEAGKVRSIGVSNYGVHHLDELEQHIKELEEERGGKGKGGVLSVGQWEIHPWLPRNDIVEWCVKRGVVIEAYSPLVRGERKNDEVFLKLAKTHVKKMWSQCLVRWSLQKGYVPLPKSVTPARIEQNAQVYDFELGPEDMELLDFDEYQPTFWDPTVKPLDK
ncbi:hypothetical protein V493_03208 [Pseudogymnoascus sp. VKM F-4281 (FW-2241)]|nr:hypothetical protein V493_03208 [Pseudogymnoascus sp. VKM F-4281 (FW-2241)]